MVSGPNQGLNPGQPVKVPSPNHWTTPNNNILYLHYLIVFGDSPDAQGAWIPIIYIQLLPWLLKKSDHNFMLFF